MTYTSTNQFNTISGNAYDRGVTTHDRAAHTLMLASYDEDSRLIMNGIDTRPGLQMLATGCVGGTAERLNSIGFTGHHKSIERMNYELRNINPMYRLHKLGEVTAFGLGRSQLRKISDKPAVYSGYVTRGRSVYVPMDFNADGLSPLPRLLWSEECFNVMREVFAMSDHCRAEDFADLHRDMQGLFLLHLIQQSQRTDTRKYFNRRLAAKFTQDKEAAIFTWTEQLRAAGFERAFA
jgi:hypothetical protein